MTDDRARRADARAPDRDLARQREVVDPFFAAAHRGDFDALVAVLDPDVVVRSDGGTAHPEPSMVLRGPAAVAEQTLGGQPVGVLGFTVSGGKIVEIDAIIDPDRLRRLDLAVLDER